MRKLIAFDDDTLDKLTQLGRDRMANGGFADLLKKHGIPIDLTDALRKSARGPSGPRQQGPQGKTCGDEIMRPDPDPFEEGQRAARKNIPAAANPYQDGSEHHALWAAGHEQVAGASEAGEAEDTA